ncbi:tryptophan synthase subunit alpha [Planctomicrobium sp. SH664]|uniref:tryptophan synthase subunit alpha n=1 Tax=Planctomicrobium sp. SH664 TaxID=3448125 RepID=UPI003F5B8D39
MSSRIAQVFQGLRAQGQMAFMPFITAGDPDLATTQSLIRQLAAAGVDLIEIGFPYSDPIADGPVIQASYTRALGNKLRVPQIFGALEELKGESLPPLVAMVSYAIVFRLGVKNFLEQCVRSGISGLIIPDLPGAEAAETFELVRDAGLDLVQMVAPTTPQSRVKQILSACSGFVYCIAVAGTTGERSDVASALLEQLAWLKRETDTPLAVGFGISRPEHIDRLRGLADGAIVGSAMVRLIEKIGTGGATSSEVLAEIGQYAEEMALTAHRSAK